MPSSVMTKAPLRAGWVDGESGWGSEMNDNLRQLNEWAVEQWGQRRDTTAGLTYGFKGGVTQTASTVARVADGTVVLTNTATNYVERTSAGVVTANIVGWTAGLIPMAVVVTAAGSISTITDYRHFAQVRAFNSLSYEIGIFSTRVQTPSLLGAAGGNVSIAANGAWAIELWTNGTQRWNVALDGNFIATTDNVLDIGASGATRPRTVYAATSVKAGTTATTSLVNGGIAFDTASNYSISQNGSNVMTIINGAAAVRLDQPTFSWWGGSTSTLWKSWDGATTLMTLTNAGALSVTGIVTATTGLSVAGSDPAALYALGIAGPSVATPLHLFRVGGAPTLYLARINTSFAAPSTMLAADVIGQAGFYGYDSVAVVPGATITATATENWTTIARGTKLSFNIRANGTISGVVALQLDQDKTATFYGSIYTTTGFNINIAAGQGIVSTGDIVVSSGAANNIYFSAGGNKWYINSTIFGANTDNTVDIGASGANRPRNLYVAGSGIFGGVLTLPAGSFSLQFGSQPVLYGDTGGVSVLQGGTSARLRVAGVDVLTATAGSIAVTLPLMGSPADLHLQTGTAAGRIVFRSSTAVELITVSNSGAVAGITTLGITGAFSNGATVSSVGDFRLKNTTTVYYRNVANSGDLRFAYLNDTTITIGDAFTSVVLGNAFTTTAAGAVSGITTLAATTSMSTPLIIATSGSISIRALGAAGDINFETTGSGLATRWQITDAGHFIAATDNVYDIGATAATRPRSIYAGTTVQSRNFIFTDGTDTVTTSITAGAVNFTTGISNTILDFQLRIKISGSTATRAGINFLSGVAPTTPVAGDWWYDGTNLKFRDSTTTKTISWT